jgi:hypothetical protein
MVHQCEDGDGDLNSGKDGNNEVSIKSDRVKYALPLQLDL